MNNLLFTSFESFNYEKDNILICDILIHNNCWTITSSWFLDPTFNPPGVGFGNFEGSNGSVYSTLTQSDGKIIIGGEFTYYLGLPRNRIARLNTDGSLDSTFNIGAGTDDDVYDVSIQKDGKIIIVGGFHFL
ncbi:MAG: delta-60 repeat domain-containing protein [Saprospiraceae bacterium]|nr:delta-60 repeat domain-containing protein [Saprospiraceae bacterium]